MRARGFLLAVIALFAVLVVAGWTGPASAMGYGTAPVRPMAATCANPSGLTLTARFDCLVGSCWACSFVGRFIKIADGLARVGFDTLRHSFASLATYFFAIWLTLQAVRLVIPWLGDPGEVLRNIVGRSFYFLIVLFVLTGSAGWYFDNFYKPALLWPSQIAQGVIDGVSRPIGKLTAATPPCGDISSNVIAAPAGLPGLSDDEIYTITCQIQASQRVVMTAIVVSLEMIQPSGTNPNSRRLTVAGAAIQIVAGVILFLVYLAALVVYPFFFIDLMFRIALISTAAPILFMTLPFPAMRQVAYKGLAGLVQSGVVLVAGSVVYGMAAILMRAAPLFFTDSAGASLGVTNEADLLARISSGSVVVDFGQMGFWWMIIGGLFLTTMLTRTTEMVRAIVAFAGDSVFGNAARAVAGSAVRNAALQPLAIGGLVAGAAAPVAGAMAWEYGGKQMAGGIARRASAIVARFNPRNAVSS